MIDKKRKKSLTGYIQPGWELKTIERYGKSVIMTTHKGKHNTTDFYAPIYKDIIGNWGYGQKVRITVEEII